MVSDSIGNVYGLYVYIKNDIPTSLPLLRTALGRNLARIILLVSIPGAPQLLRSDWLYRHCEWLTNSKYEYLRRAGILVASMRRIKNVSAGILAEKISEASAIVASDSTLEGKKDVMSLLVQSRIRDLGHGSEGYKMSDSMMMEQVVCIGLLIYR